MGGCRCTFRTCTVNTGKYPQMHFFHYPMKSQERLEKWVKYANFPQIYRLAPKQAKNKVICALHFRDDCFMNYKKDRLIPTAIPTLSRIKNGLVVDYSAPELKPFTLAPPTEKHLIPPKGYIPFGLPSIDSLNSSMLALHDVEESINSPEPKRPKILNKFSLATSFINGHSENDTITLTSATSEDDDYSIALTSNGDSLNESVSQKQEVHGVVEHVEMLNFDDIELLESEKEDCIENESEHLVSKAIYEETVEAFEREVIDLKAECDKKERDADARVTAMQHELAEAKEAMQHALDKVNTAETLANDWKKKVEALEAKNAELAKAAAAEPPKQKYSASSSVPLTKAQLFNGIKKYLSASMTALVRMEMFGGSEREWKPDEKQASVELLRLGDAVYKYFSDEWRFRLPPKKLVEDWRNQVTEEDEDDL